LSDFCLVWQIQRLNISKNNYSIAYKRFPRVIFLINIFDYDSFIIGSLSGIGSSTLAYLLILENLDNQIIY
jgi:hypothetical protein